jgi:hypothetical protein
VCFTDFAGRREIADTRNIRTPLSNFAVTIPISSYRTPLTGVGKGKHKVRFFNYGLQISSKELEAQTGFGRKLTNSTALSTTFSNVVTYVIIAVFACVT